MKITKTTLTAVLAVILATGQVACKVDTGIDDLADVLGDALDDDDNCRVAMRQNENNGNGRGDPHDDDNGQETVDETVEETIEEATESNESEPCSTASNDDDSVEYGDETPVDGDTSGGIMIPEATDGDLESRVSLGTWRLNSYSTCQQDFIYSADRHDAPPIPDNVRIYSNIYTDEYQTLDFQNTTGDLVTIATVYPDDTFDFMMRFLDQFGAPSETLNCTCEIIEAYYEYTPDQIDCLCNPSQTANDCTVKYDKL